MSVRTPLLFPETKDLLKDPAENSNALILAKISKTSGLYHLRKTLQTQREFQIGLQNVSPTPSVQAQLSITNRLSANRLAGVVDEKCVLPDVI